MGTLALIVVTAALFVGAVVAVLAFRNAREGGSIPSSAILSVRWIVLVAVLLMVGLVIAPRLLGFTFLILPILLIVGSGRRKRED